MYLFTVSFGELNYWVFRCLPATLRFILSASYMIRSRGINAHMTYRGTCSSAKDSSHFSALPIFPSADPTHSACGRGRHPLPGRRRPAGHLPEDGQPVSRCRGLFLETDVGVSRWC